MESFESGLTAFVIFFREGTEVLLILFAIYSITGRPVLPIVLGGATGIGVNVALGLALGFAGFASAIADKAIMLTAAAMMLYVARGLMLWRLTGGEKKGRLQDLATRTMGKPLLVYALTAFVVGREVFELLLFSEALSIRAGGWSQPIFIGIGVALLGLILVYVLLDRLADRVPMRVIFAISSAWLVVQAGLLIWEVFA
jgi:high-affinity iron transporter